MWFTIYHNINGNNISQGITSAYKHGITSAITNQKNYDTHLLIHFHVYIKLLRSTFSSDLRKPCLETGKSLSLCWKKLFCSWENPNYMMSNRMRSIHMYVIILSVHISGIANNAIFFSGVVISLNNNESNNIYLSASTSTLHIVFLELGIYFVLGTNINI